MTAITSGEHARREIREAILSAQTGLGNMGKGSEFHPTKGDEYLAVYTDDEQLIETGTPETRRLKVTIEVRIKRKRLSDPLRVADQKAVIVEKNMRSDPTFGGRVDNLEYVDTSVSRVIDVEKPSVNLTITYTCDYRIDATTFAEFLT